MLKFNVKIITVKIRSAQIMGYYLIVSNKWDNKS